MTRSCLRQRDDVKPLCTISSKVSCPWVSLGHQCLWQREVSCSPVHCPLALGTCSLLLACMEWGSATCSSMQCRWDLGAPLTDLLVWPAETPRWPALCSSSGDGTWVSYIHIIVTKHLTEGLTEGQAYFGSFRRGS